MGTYICKKCMKPTELRARFFGGPRCDNCGVKIESREDYIVNLKNYGKLIGYVEYYDHMFRSMVIARATDAIKVGRAISEWEDFIATIKRDPELHFPGFQGVDEEIDRLAEQLGVSRVSIPYPPE